MQIGRRARILAGAWWTLAVLAAGLVAACGTAPPQARPEGPAGRIVSLDYCADQFVLGLAADTRDRGTSGPTGLWILPVMWKTPAMRSAQLSGRRRRVSHNTLDAADGAHRLHRHLRPCSRTPRHE